MSLLTSVIWSTSNFGHITNAPWLLARVRNSLPATIGRIPCLHKLGWSPTSSNCCLLPIFTLFFMSPNFVRPSEYPNPSLKSLPNYRMTWNSLWNRRLSWACNQLPWVSIQWKDLPTFEATWEPYEMVQHQFPTFHLEDKVTLLARGIDKPLICFTYARCAKKGM
ncbi:Chromo domain-like [Parasponia andersonii]|uniref:Chromo domain-like n=1 Tax=Parasponia andersonii TaxID=3476 RepID=A0A2P5C260_PARAD|nr:Chromo domain-like [Parasponia andersonii]